MPLDDSKLQTVIKGLQIASKLSRRIALFIEDYPLYRCFIFAGREMRSVLYNWCRLLAMMVREHHSHAME